MPTTRRQDDYLIKWVLGFVASIFILFLGQFIFMIQSNAALVERVSINTRDIKDLKVSKIKLIRVEVMGEMTLNKINEIAGTMKIIGNVTNNHTRDIRDFKIFVDNQKMAKQ